MLLKFYCRGDSLDTMKLRSQMMVGKKEFFAIILKFCIKGQDYLLISTRPTYIADLLADTIF